VFLGQTSLSHFLIRFDCLHFGLFDAIHCIDLSLFRCYGCKIDCSAVVAAGFDGDGCASFESHMNGVDENENENYDVNETADDGCGDPDDYFHAGDYCYGDTVHMTHYVVDSCFGVHSSI
jgi:hypothetical protein